MKKLRNILAIALVLCLMAGLMPMAAFADDANMEENMEETGSEVTDIIKRSAEDAGSENSGDAGETDNHAADNNAADNAAAAENAPGNGVPQAPESFTASAPEAPVAPVEPDLTGLSDKAANEKIRLYNEEVNRYNEAVEQYNTEFEAYEAAAKEYNAAVKNFNDHAASYNALADEHNQAEQKKLDAYHTAMEDYKQKAGPYLDYQKKIDAVSDRNLAMAEEQRESLGDISRLDKKSILSLGTVLEEDYTVNYGWRSSILGHAGDLLISWDALIPGTDHSTIQIQKGEQSDETYKVANLHIFEDFKDFSEMSDYQSELGWDCMNINVDDENGVIIIPRALIDRIAMIEIEVAEVGKNDTVTVVGQNSVFAGKYVTSVGRFFEGYTDGPHWLSAGTVFQSTAVDSESDWTGTGHTFSYSQGTTDRAGIKNPLNVNHYVFQRYSNPYTLPEQPEEVTVDMMDKAESLTFIEILGSKLSRLLGLPEREIRAKRNRTPDVPVVPAMVEIPEEVTPLAEPEQKDEEPAVNPVPVSSVSENIGAQISPLVFHEFAEEISDDEIPLASGASWALVNLIASLLTVLLAVASLVSRREKEDGENDEKETRVRLSVVFPAVVSVIVFILTENMHNPMVLVNVWTPVMLLILAGGCMLNLFVARRDQKESSKT